MGLVDQSNDALKSSSLLAKVNMSGKPDGSLYRMFSVISLRKLNLHKEGGPPRQLAVAAVVALVAVAAVAATEAVVTIIS